MLATAHLIKVIFIAYPAVNCTEARRGRGRDLAPGDPSRTALKTTAVARGHTIRAIHLLKHSSLKQVLLVLDHDAPLSHHYGVRTHVL